MDISGFPVLANVRIGQCVQLDLTISNTQPIIELRAEANQIPLLDVNAALVALDANGLNNGTVNLSGQVPIAVPTGGGAAAVANLVVKGWTVIVDTAITDVVMSDGIGGFYKLIVDGSGNLGTTTDAGPATADVILDDGSGGFWKLIVDAAGNRGSESNAGPATSTPVLDDGVGGHWQVVVDVYGNLGTVSV